MFNSHSALSSIRMPDAILSLLLFLLIMLGLTILYSASGESTAMLTRQAIRVSMGLVAMFFLTQIPVKWFRLTSVWIYLTALILLVLVMVVGDVGKGAQRWLDLGVIRFQPSEMMKLGMPMMIASYFSRRVVPPTLKDIAASFLLIIVPVLLIVKQPDLGTSILVASSGFLVMYFAGMSWLVIFAGLGFVLAFIPVFWNFFMREYQKQRVMTLLDPESDPLGAGYHIIQSKIALGSGGTYGKGWLDGTQSQLKFLPERTTDFIFAVYGEEFGWIGVLLLFSLYVFITVRGLMIARSAGSTYDRLLAASISTTFFIYFLVNVGMVSGLLPVVGVPLPLVSYGGTSIVTLLAGFGILMSINNEKRLVSQ